MINKGIFIALLVIFTCQAPLTVTLRSPKFDNSTKCVNCDSLIFNEATNSLKQFVFNFSS